VEELAMLFESQRGCILLLQVLVSTVDWLFGDVSHCTAHCKLEGSAQRLEAEPWPWTQSRNIVLVQWF
jgi:hypothetical protein